MKFTVEPSAWGWRVRNRAKFPNQLYVRFMRNGEAEFTTDYAHAKHYKSERLARKIADMLSK